MKVAIIKERRAHERRVAASPDTVKHMTGMRLDVLVESGAGAEAYFTDEAYRAAGATIVPDPAAALRSEERRVGKEWRSRWWASSDKTEEVCVVVVGEYAIMQAAVRSR